MNIIDFKTILSNNNINLSDAELRIANYRYNHLVKTSQIIDNNFFDKLCIKNKCLVDIFINSLVDNNTNKINYIINSLI
jgi:hypothetical protein